MERLSRAIVVGVLLVGLGAGALAGEKQLTSEEVLRRVADTYRNLKTYYDETTGRSVSIGPTGQNVRTSTVKTAFKRPNLLRVEKGGRYPSVTVFDGSERFFYHLNSNSYYKSEATIDEAVPHPRFPLIAGVIVAKDPYEYMMEDVLKLGPLETVEFVGKKVHSIELRQDKGATVRLYIDMKGFHLVGMNGHRPAREGEKERSFSTTVSNVCIDRVPTDKSGAPMDVFIFEIPKDAVAMFPESDEPGSDKEERP